MANRRSPDGVLRTVARARADPLAGTSGEAQRRSAMSSDSAARSAVTRTGCASGHAIVPVARIVVAGRRSAAMFTATESFHHRSVPLASTIRTAGRSTDSESARRLVEPPSAAGDAMSVGPSETSRASSVRRTGGSVATLSGITISTVLRRTATLSAEMRHGEPALPAAGPAALRTSAATFHSPRASCASVARKPSIVTTPRRTSRRASDGSASPTPMRPMVTTGRPEGSARTTESRLHALVTPPSIDPMVSVTPGARAARTCATIASLSRAWPQSVSSATNAAPTTVAPPPATSAAATSNTRVRRLRTPARD